MSSDSPARPVRGASPTTRLVAALVLSILAIVGFGAYAVNGIRELRDEQTRISERNRLDSLQLLRIQNNLATLATTMRDMVDRTEPYPTVAWRHTFQRLRADLDHAIALERTLAPASRQPAQQARLDRAVGQFWQTLDRVFELAGAGQEEEALALVRSTATIQHQELVGLVSQLFVMNNQVQQDATVANRAVYARVERDMLLLVAGLLIVVVAGGSWIIAANRRAFEEVRQLSTQLRELSWRTIRIQEDLQHAWSRELHDEFGQILTAMGTLLGRIRRNLPDGSPLMRDVDEVRSIAQDTLERIRTQSRVLHPVILDDFGLEPALQWYVEQFGRQHGIRVHFTQEGTVGPIPEGQAIHFYRIVQEALNNVSRHSGADEAWVRLRSANGWIELEIEDHGRGLPAEKPRDIDRASLGLVGMRERAELMGGQFALRRPPQGGVMVAVRVPRAAPVPAPARKPGSPPADLPRVTVS